MPISRIPDSKASASQTADGKSELRPRAASPIDISQGRIRKQLQLYLAKEFAASKKEKRVGDYKAKDLFAIRGALSKGHCHGLAVMWAQLSLLNQEHTLSQDLQKIAQWDYAQPLTSDLAKKMDHLTQIMRFYQDEDIDQMKLFLKPQQNLLEILDDDQYTTPYQTLSKKEYGQKELIKLLDTIIKSNNIVMISGGGHVVAVSKRNKKCHLFDANIKGDEASYNSEHSAITHDTLETLSAQVLKQLSAVKADKDQPLFLTLQVLDLKQNKNTYPPADHSAIVEHIAAQPIGQERFHAIHRLFCNTSIASEIKTKIIHNLLEAGTLTIDGPLINDVTLRKCSRHETDFPGLAEILDDYELYN